MQPISLGSCPMEKDRKMQREIHVVCKQPQGRKCVWRAASEKELESSVHPKKHTQALDKETERRKNYAFLSQLCLTMLHGGGSANVCTDFTSLRG